MRLTDHQRALWTCLMRSLVCCAVGASGDLRSWLWTQWSYPSTTCAKTRKAVAGSSVAATRCCRVSSFQTRSPFRSLCWRVEGKANSVTSRGLLLVNGACPRGGAFQFISTRVNTAELNWVSWLFSSAKAFVWVCISVPLFLLTVFAAALSGCPAVFPHRWGRSLISTVPPGWGPLARGRPTLLGLNLPSLVVDRTRPHSPQTCKKEKKLKWCQNGSNYINCVEQLKQQHAHLKISTCRS